MTRSGTPTTPRPKHPGVQMSHAERHRRTGRVRVECYLDEATVKRLDNLARVLGTRRAVIEAAILVFDGETE